MNTVLQPSRQKWPGPLLCARAACTQAATWAWASKAPWRARPPTPQCGPCIRRRWIQPNGRAARSGKQNRTAPASSRTLTLIRYSPSLSHSLSRSVRTERAKQWSGQPWRRRRPPCRRARSPAGERTVVERPGRGAPLAEPGEQLPGSALSSPRAPARQQHCSAAR